MEKVGKYIFLILLSIAVISCGNDEKVEQADDINLTVSELLSNRWKMERINHEGFPRVPKSESYFEFRKNGKYALKMEELNRDGEWLISWDGRSVILDSGKAEEWRFDFYELNKENLWLRYYEDGRITDLRFSR